MKRSLHYSLFVFLLAVFFAGAAFAVEFPLREKYPDLQPISTEDLAAKQAAGGAVVVDVRSAFEFETIHVKDARHVSLAKKSFLKDLEAVRGKNATEALVFYCNGTTCAKSYKATKKAVAAGFNNCYVYDAGIFNWTKARPADAVLLGSNPADPAKLIAKSELKAKMLPYAEFQAKAKAGGVVIDIRDPMQRKQRLDLGKQRNVPLDRIGNMLKRGDMKDKELLIYDAVGKQVRWLQYHLEKHGYSDYAFLDGGVRKALAGS